MLSSKNKKKNIVKILIKLFLLIYYINKKLR